MTILRLVQVFSFLCLAILFAVPGVFAWELQQSSAFTVVPACDKPDCKDHGDCKGPDCKGNGPVPVVKSISWEEMKERCAHPTQFDVQRPPQNIRIQCAETRFSWVAGPSLEVNLPSIRNITTGVLADKFVVNAEQKDYQFLSKPGMCQRFKKVEEILSVERPVSCAEILGMKGDLGDLCGSMLDVLKGSNPKLVEVRETSEVLDTCGVISGQGGDKDKGDRK